MRSRGLEIRGCTPTRWRSKETSKGLEVSGDQPATDTTRPHQLRREDTRPRDQGPEGGPGASPVWEHHGLRVRVSEGLRDREVGWCTRSITSYCTHEHIG